MAASATARVHGGGGGRRDNTYKNRARGRLLLGGEGCFQHRPDGRQQVRPDLRPVPDNANARVRRRAHAPRAAVGTRPRRLKGGVLRDEAEDGGDGDPRGGARHCRDGVAQRVHRIAKVQLTSGDEVVDSIAAARAHGRRAVVADAGEQQADRRLVRAQGAANDSQAAAARVGWGGVVVCREGGEERASLRHEISAIVKQWWCARS